MESFLGNKSLAFRVQLNSLDMYSSKGFAEQSWPLGYLTGVRNVLFRSGHHLFHLLPSARVSIFPLSTWPVLLHPFLIPTPNVVEQCRIPEQMHAKPSLPEPNKSVRFGSEGV